MKRSKLKIKGFIISILIICSIFINACSNNDTIKTEELVDNLVPTEITEYKPKEDKPEEDMLEDIFGEDLPEENLPKDDIPQEDLNIDETTELKETVANKNYAETIEFN